MARLAASIVVIAPVAGVSYVYPIAATSYALPVADIAYILLAASSELDITGRYQCVLESVVMADGQTIFFSRLLEESTAQIDISAKTFLLDEPVYFSRYVVAGYLAGGYVASDSVFVTDDLQVLRY
ncbi:MAG: hypothetical protein HQ446_06235 [Polaromonas sp.]|nr:hypothetical protein [Polaromonas sp.]